MLDDLIDRDQEDSLRYAVRHVAGPDGAPLTLRCYRLVWRWFNHLTAYEFGPDGDEILETAHGIAHQYALPLEIALGYAVTRHVYELE